MGLDEGYIGITVNPKSRWRAHRTRKCNPHLTNALLRYDDSILYSILSVHDSEEDARWQEYTLRPCKNIGWNIAQGGTKSPILAIGGLSKESLYKIKIANVGRKHTQVTKDKISAGNKGKVRSLSFRLESSKRNSGLGSNRAKPANIYNYNDNSLVANDVVIREWARENGFDHSTLVKTTKSNLSLPSTRYNPHHYKNYYARYTDDCR